jgi:biopolymer transport protein ExbB
MLELFQKGGPVMYFILLCSLVAAVIIIERLIYFHRIRVDEDSLLARLKASLARGQAQEALSLCEAHPSPIANLMKVGLENRRQPKQVIREAILDAANLEVPRLERFLSTLGTVGNLATLLGLLGTVTGNIKSFGVIGQLGVVGDPGLLARGIAEALLTTAFGLIVAIPVIFFYNFLVTRVNNMVTRLESRVNQLVSLLEGSKNAL